MYYLRMTQEEIDAYWLVFRKVFSRDNTINNIILNITNCFGEYTSINKHNTHYINSFEHKSTSPYMLVNNIDKSFVNKLEYKYKNELRDNNQDVGGEKFKYIVCFDSIDLTVINTISNHVGGEKDTTQRIHFTGNNLMCSLVLNKIFGCKKYMNTGYCDGSYIFKK